MVARRALRALRLYSTRVWDISSTDASTPPTLEAIDALRPTSHIQPGVPAHLRDASRWQTAFRNVNDSFTRPQLLRLAQEAALKDIRVSKSKAQLVRAFLEQRFGLRDPEERTDFSAFIPLELGNIFLLAHNGAELFAVARKECTTFRIKHDASGTGVKVVGSERAVQVVREWLAAFNEVCSLSDVLTQSIQCTSMPGSMPQSLLQWVSHRTLCHLEQNDSTIRLRYVNEESARNAQILIQQYCLTVRKVCACSHRK